MINRLNGALLKLIRSCVCVFVIISSSSGSISIIVIVVTVVVFVVAKKSLQKITENVTVTFYLQSLKTFVNDQVCEKAKALVVSWEADNFLNMQQFNHSMMFYL